MDKQPICTVVMDGVKEEANEFIALLTEKNGNVGIIYNADALTLGMGLQLTATSFLDSLEECNEEDRSEIIDILMSRNILNKRYLTQQILESIPFLDE